MTSAVVYAHCCRKPLAALQETFPNRPQASAPEIQSDADYGPS